MRKFSAGRTKEEAFELGYRIANDVSGLNPHPVKLKFEVIQLVGFYPHIQSQNFRRS